MKNKFLLALVAIVLATILFKAVSFSPELESFSGPTMGTTYTIKYTTTADAPSREELKTLVDDVLVHVNKKIKFQQMLISQKPKSELVITMCAWKTMN